MTGFDVTVAIVFIGLLFGTLQKFGNAIAVAIIDRLYKPATIRIKKEDGSIERVNLTHKENIGFRKIWDKLNLDARYWAYFFNILETFYPTLSHLSRLYLYSYL